MAIVYILLNLILFLIYWPMITIITIRILLKRRPVTSTLTWLLIIYIIPLLGAIAYIAFGELYLGKKRIMKAKSVWPSTVIWLKKIKCYKYIFCKDNSNVARPLFKLCEKRQGISGIKGNKIQLLTNYQEALTNIIQDINSANYNIEMVFYIWQEGGLVDKVTEALINAANRGIKCRIMIDSAGSWAFFHSRQPEKMRKAGIELIESLKVNFFRFFLRRMDLRQHRKIIIIDNHISYVGSMNMVDPRFFKQNAGVGQWIDIVVRMEGPVSTILGVIYAFDWEMETGQLILPTHPNSKIIQFEQTKGNTTQIIASGPGFPEELIQQSLITAIFSARNKLILTTPYFVPSDTLMYAICTAAMRGVEVLIVIPNKNNFFLVRWASRAFYSQLLESGVKIYQFNDGLLHTKSLSVDGELSLLGSVNLDMRSLWLNFEITVVIDDKNFGNDLIFVQYDYISRSIPLTQKTWNKRPLWNRIIERICYFFSPFL
ncbi:Cardiolipin synthase [Candidatus Arsenophonus lipoptenae]|uniref:Cardiolipin synthase A n=1 Tax=Candidatus Arsenophonus lipoptenae TaxID=634113 RepID=A0A0X9VQU7_9GAMM|nr:cardiolipin synthase [Candidatus Arsenophonus lipoptenae]AMA64652.1 Cardiolipin synthase [Candidatus Arsenophonus lipoptenae]